MFEKLQEVLGNKWVRITLLLIVIGGGIYRSSIFNSIIAGEKGLSYYFTRKPIFFSGAISPLTRDKEQKCSNFIQLTGAINQGLVGVMDDFNKEEVGFLVTQEKLKGLEKDLEEIVIVEHGALLHTMVKESLELSHEITELLEDVKKTRTVSDEEERRVWEEKKDYIELLDYKLNELAEDRMDTVRALLKEYDMSHTEYEDGIEYFYWGTEPQ